MQSAACMHSSLQGLQSFRTCEYQFHNIIIQLLLLVTCNAVAENWCVPQKALQN